MGAGKCNAGLIGNNKAVVDCYTRLCCQDSSTECDWATVEMPQLFMMSTKC